MPIPTADSSGIEFIGNLARKIDREGTVEWISKVSEPSPLLISSEPLAFPNIELDDNNILTVYYGRSSDTRLQVKHFSSSGKAFEYYPDDLHASKIKTQLISEDSKKPSPTDNASLSWTHVWSWLDTSTVDHMDLLELDSEAFVAAYVLKEGTTLNCDIGIKDGVDEDGLGRGKLVQRYQAPFHVKYKEEVRVLEACNDASGNL